MKIFRKFFFLFIAGLTILIDLTITKNTFFLNRSLTLFIGAGCHHKFPAGKALQVGIFPQACIVPGSQNKDCPLLEAYPGLLQATNVTVKATWMDSVYC